MRGDIKDYTFDLLVTKAGIDEDVKLGKKTKGPAAKGIR